MLRPIFVALTLLVATLGPAPAQAEAPPPCPPSFGVVERTVGPPVIYLPTNPASPETCDQVQRGGAIAHVHYGTWNTEWPGADQALIAYRKVYREGPGSVARFDVAAAPGYTWHAIIRNEGFEDINLLGAIHRTMKVSHEREGYGGNTYHSIITQWKDVATGMTIYQTYNHIAGMPESGTSWNPLTIYSAR